MKQQPMQLLPFFWHIVKPYRWYFIGMMITGLIWGIQTTLSPYLLKLIINGIADYSGNKANILSVIKIPAILYTLLFVLMTFNFRITDWFVLRATPGIRQDIIVTLFTYLKQHSHQYFQNHFAGSLLNKITDMASGGVSVLQKLEQTFSQVCVLIIAMVAMFFVNPLFAVILVGWAFLFILTSLAFTKKIKTRSHLFSTSKTETAGNIVDSISNIINSRLFARQDFEVSRIKTAVIDTVAKDRDMQRYVLYMRIYQDISIVSLMGLMLLTLIIMYSKGKVTLGDFAFVLSISISMFQIMWFLASQFVQFAEDLGQCAQALSIISTPHDIVDAPNAQPLQVTHGKIEFENVTFSYNINNPLFKNINLLIEPGKKVGFVGFSGSGKTTCVNLILRFFDVTSGRILIDDQNIANVTQNSLHQSIAMIPQDTSLFHRSLIENIRYGRLDATDAEVIDAAQRAHCHEFISQLTEGYHSLVGERGIKLSGGQRQRIAIARALLKQAPILLLDEATSALDSVTERCIQEGLHTLMQGCTTIVIAHRLSTLAEMDRILVFDKGNIIEDGNHSELLKANGHYAKMWKMQAGGFLPNQE